MDHPVTDETLAAIGGLSTATVHYLLMMRGVGRKYGAGPIRMNNVASLAPGRRLVGRAVTLRYLPMREDLQALVATSGSADGMNATPRWRVVEACGPGSVLVSDALGLSNCSTGGEIVYGRLHQRGAAGVVTDGAIRDARQVADLGWPVFAGGRTSMVGETLIMPYEFNVPVQCGGVLVWPGDVVLGDDDGVVVISSSLAGEIARSGTEHEAVEDTVLDAMRTRNAPPSAYYPFNADTYALHEARLRRERGESGAP